MCKRPRTDQPSDRVVLNVGGDHFTTSISMLSSNSTYFEALFSRWDKASEVFLDRDPDAFRVLLSCMRQRRVMLPKCDNDLFERSVLDAAFLVAARVAARVPGAAATRAVAATHLITQRIHGRRDARAAPHRGRASQGRGREHTQV